MHLVVITARPTRRPLGGEGDLQGVRRGEGLALSESVERGAIVSSLPWYQTELEETRRLMGDDFWPYGVESNRATLEAAVRYSRSRA